MQTSNSRIPVQSTLICALVYVFTTGACAIDLYSDTLPQAQPDTCQSYAMVLALAAKGDPVFPITTFAQIRKSESEFRGIAASLPGGPFGHDALKRAGNSYTSGAYRLEVEYTATDIVAWLSRVRVLTTLDSSADALIGRLTNQKFPVALTSVTKFADSTYADGHVIAILGVLGSGLNASTRLLAFNSAIKGQGGSVNRCEPGTQPGDEKYKAGVVSTNNVVLKEFPKYVVMHLEKN